VAVKNNATPKVNSLGATRGNLLILLVN